MLYIDYRLASISRRNVMAYGVMPSQPGHEIVPGQLYFGQTEWRRHPLEWVDQTWRRTDLFKQLGEECCLPDPEYSLGPVGFRWFIFRFRPDYPISERVGHRPAQHRRVLQQWVAQLKLEKTK
jgi:hypothetical protein